MREIKFRGYSKTKEGWIYGLPEYFKDKIHAIQTKQRTAIQIDLESLGQYTGIHDIRGIEIYEDDVVKHRVGKGRVYYDEAETSYILEPISGVDEYLVLGLEWDLEVIGDIHDNPEFLEKR